MSIQKLRKYYGRYTFQNRRLCFFVPCRWASDPQWQGALQKLVGEDGYAFIGGHVAFGETTAETIVREFKEEIGADIKVERLFMVNENFFPWGTRPCQQINLYYLVSLKDETQIPIDRNFKALDELGNERIELDMCWIPLEDIPNKSIYPPQAKEYIMNLPDEIVYFVYKE